VPPQPTTLEELEHNAIVKQIHKARLTAKRIEQTRQDRRAEEAMFLDGHKSNLLLVNPAVEPEILGCDMCSQRPMFLG
jgi:hypothetical protein